MVLAWAQVEKGAGWIFNIASAEALGPFPSAPVRRHDLHLPVGLLGRARDSVSLATHAWPVACH